jgi:hypothetical protein
MGLIGSAPALNRGATGSTAEGGNEFVQLPFFPSGDMHWDELQLPAQAGPGTDVQTNVPV